MADYAIQVEGMRELRKALKMIQDPNLAGALKVAHRKASEAAAIAVAAEAPVGKTGKLRQSVRARPTMTQGRVWIGFNASVPYAGPIHFGWKKRNIKPNKFAYRGIKRQELPIAEIYAKDVDRILRAAGMRAGI